MKYLALLAIPFSLCIAQENAVDETTPEAAQETTEETTSAVSPADDEVATQQEATGSALADEAKPYLEAARSHINLLRQLRDVLKNVNDTASADAAAEEVDALAQQVKAAMEQEQALPEPSQEVQYLVSAETATLDLEELTGESVGKAIELQEMETPSFGSGALDQALNALLSLYLQDEEEE